ncbi:hypothetical protein SAMN05421503_2787 [Terribacillus aidingensis]|uniref:Phr family secreted Rap phosphatase inhibitor n=1 Tax=Terribacillus aidingensis TaxID=586416 RepID=A0A285P409_9BACI|nr:hypothetical protein [Terribacillus aidingensis]SNZ15893.1 hypothetical protein SAMN05421503_2787 [Terribacillus aidingensis]
MKKIIIAVAVVVTLGASFLLSNDDVHTADNQPGIYTIINLPF